MCVLIKDLRRSVAYVCANKRLRGSRTVSSLSTGGGVLRPRDTSKMPIFAKSRPPTPPYFAMYMQLKDLQRSVGDRYANKGLSDFKTARPDTEGVLPSCGFVFADRVRSAAALPQFNRRICFGVCFFFLCVLCVSAFNRFPVFFPPSKSAL